MKRRQILYYPGKYRKKMNKKGEFL